MEYLSQKITAFKNKYQMLGIVFIIPAVIMIITFLIVPTIMAARFSLYNYNLLRADLMEFVGLENYVNIVSNSEFWKSLKNTFYFVVLIVPFQSGLALFMAVLIHDGSKKINTFFRIGFFSPVITSIVVISILWTFLYAKNGLINNFLGNFGINPQAFLTSEDQAMNSIIFMSGWQMSGYFMMIFLAGLKEIPKSLYEAAAIDGAGMFKSFIHITLPGLRNVIKFVVVMTTIQAFKLFQQPFIMTGGGPNGSTQTIVQFIYKQGFQYRNAGYSAAISIIFFFIIILVSVLTQKLMKDKDY